MKFFIRIITAIVLSSPDPDDLAFLMNHLQPMASHWKAFGLQLGLLPGELDNIEATPLLMSGGPPAFLQEVLKRWMNRAPPFPTLSKLCDSLRSRAVHQSRIALELEQQYQTQRTGLSAHKPRTGSSLELPNLKPMHALHIYHCKNKITVIANCLNYNYVTILPVLFKEYGACKTICGRLISVITA